MGIFDSLKDFWRRQSKNFKVILSTNIINTLGGAGGGPGGGGGGGRYGSIFLRSLGAGYVEIGLLNSISNLVGMILSIPSGMLVDRVKRVKRLHLTGRLFSLPISLVSAAARSWRIFLGTRVWGAITGRITMPTMNIITIDSYSDRDRVAGLAVTQTITSAIGLFTPLILAYVIHHFGGLDNAPDSLRIIFIIQFFVGVISFLLLLLKLEEPKFTRTKPTSGVLSSMFGIFREVPGLYRFLLLNVLTTFLMGVRQPFMQLYFYEVKNATVFIIGWQGTVSTASRLLLSVPMSRVADRVGRRKLAYMGRIAFAFCVLSAILTPPTHPELLLTYSFLAALGSSMEVGWNAFQQEYIPLRVRGRWSGITSLASSIVSIPAPLIGGLIWNFNPDIAWWLGVINYAFVSLPIMMSIKDRKTEPHAS